VRKYELMYIIRPDREEKEIKDTITLIEKVFKDQKAKVINKEEIGQKELAYPILKHTKGYYNLYQLEASVEAIGEIDRLIRLNENIIRYLIINIED